MGRLRNGASPQNPTLTVVSPGTRNNSSIACKMLYVMHEKVQYQNTNDAVTFVLFLYLHMEMELSHKYGIQNGKFVITNTAYFIYPLPRN